MKKTLLTLLIGLFSLSTLHAGKAWPYPITVIQSNGTPITVFLHGDENFHWYTDQQGNILERTGNDFKAITVDKETFFAQTKVAQLTRGTMLEPIAPTPSNFPHTGSPRAVVILAQYTDRKFTTPNPRASFDQYLNAASGHPVDLGTGENLNYGSVKQYFMEQSDSTYSPQFDVYGPITLPQNMAYYGGTSDGGDDEKYIQLLTDACNAVKDSVDFTQYDQDQDGKIDLVYIVYAGYGQSNGGPNETMWAKSFYGFSSPTFDGKGINRGGISNELNGFEGAFGYNLTPQDTTKTFSNAVKYINGVGLFIHEFSHCLGLPDFYGAHLDASKIYDNQGMEGWSVMDAGTYISMGYCPRNYTAWEREALGWEIIPTISASKQYSLIDEKGKRAVKVLNPINPNEYFVLELFEDKGWDQRFARLQNSQVNYNPSTKGLLLYHVDYDATAFSLSYNRVNDVVGHPRMAVVPADGILKSSYWIDNGITSLQYYQQLNGDLFRVDGDINSPLFTQADGLPVAAWWTAADPTPIRNINYYWGAVYFDFLDSVATTSIDKTIRGVESSEDSKIYTLDGRFVGTSTDALPHGIYIRNGRKFVR